MSNIDVDIFSSRKIGGIKVKDSRGDKIFYAIIITILLLTCSIMLYPFIYVISVSISNPYRVMAGEVWLLPKEISFDGYIRVLSNNDIWTGYANTILYTALGTLVQVSCTAMFAFPLSRKDFYGKGFFTMLLVIPMFFSGGLIPAYLLIMKLGWIDTRFLMVIQGAVSTYYIIVMRTFIKANVPEGVQEAAVIDGANELYIFWKIVLPLCKPVLAVMALFFGVMQWNSYFNPMIYLETRSKFPLQLFLREILVQNDLGKDMALGISQEEQNYLGVSIQYATAMVATIPILCVYPFLQKYFVKGMLIGSIKG